MKKCEPQSDFQIMRVKNPATKYLMSEKKHANIFKKYFTKIAYFRQFVQNALSMRAFLMRGNFQICPTVSCARKKSEMRVFLRASKIRRGFQARAFQNFGDKKAGKTFIFQIKKSEEKKPMTRIRVCLKKCDRSSNGAT